MGLVVLSGYRKSIATIITTFSQHSRSILDLSFSKAYNNSNNLLLLLFFFFFCVVKNKVPPHFFIGGKKKFLFDGTILLIENKLK